MIRFEGRHIRIQGVLYIASIVKVENFEVHLLNISIEEDEKKKSHQWNHCTIRHRLAYENEMDKVNIENKSPTLQYKSICV